MRLLRQIANRALRAGLDELSRAPEPVVERAYGWVRRAASAAGLPIPADVDTAVLRNLAQVIGGAIIATEYGAGLRFEHPLVVTLAVSGYCPFACANCYANSSADAPVAAGSNEIDNYARVASMKTPFVVTTGGEPLADPRFVSGLTTLLDAGKMVYVATNAAIDRYLPLAERHRQRLAFLFSIWGPRERHNELRGENAFERVERNCKSLAARGLRANLLVVLTNNDLSVLTDVSDLLRKYPVASVRIIRKIGVGRLTPERFEPTAAHWRELRHEIGKLRTHCRTVVADIPELRRTQRRAAFARRALGIPGFDSCAAGAWMMHVDGSGAAYPCFVFESRGRAQVPAGLLIGEQWALVRRARQSLSSNADCVGEEIPRRKEPV